MLNIVVPMAGRGSRFAGSADAEPKPFIEVVPGRRMIEYVIDYLAVDEPHRFIFVCLSDHVRSFAPETLFAAHTTNFAIVGTEAVTGGPSASALLARRYIDNGDELLVAYADGAIDFRTSDFLAFARRANADGATVVFPADSPALAYVRQDDTGRIRRTAEKARISSLAADGLYYFRRGSEFVSAAETMAAADAAAGRESFVCPVFNSIIASGGIVVGYPIAADQRIAMGTPEDLAAARRRLGMRHPIAAHG